VGHQATSDDAAGKNGGAERRRYGLTLQPNLDGRRPRVYAASAG
jgi:hypothetical protein